MSFVPHVQVFSTNGDGTGSTSITANYSVTPDEFYVQAPAGKDYHIHRIIIYVEDATIDTMTEFGGLAELTNGITITLENDAGTELADLTPIPITQNGDWARYAHDLILHSGFATGNDVYTARWTFSKFSPEGIILRNSENLIATAQDNFTGIEDFTIVAEGHLSTVIH